MTLDLQCVVPKCQLLLHLMPAPGGPEEIICLVKRDFNLWEHWVALGCWWKPPDEFAGAAGYYCGLGDGWMPEPAPTMSGPAQGLVKTRLLMGALGWISCIPTFAWLKGAQLCLPCSLKPWHGLLGHGVPFYSPRGDFCWGQ